LSVFFTSDTHFGHANIIKYCKRPFSSVKEHDDALIKNWNDVVKDNDDVYHLGDVALSKYTHGYLTELLDRLAGRIHLLRGNHDKGIEKGVDRFEEVRDIIVAKIADHEAQDGLRRIVLCHYAMRVWDRSHHGSWHLYGHSHGTLSEDPNSLSFDVGVDCCAYRPISYAEVKAIMSKKTWKQIDRHNDVTNV
jgi:calcineurin-like phosphoesterase family protein